MWRSRKLIALFLLTLFVPVCTAASLPLVWCVAPNGHNAVEAWAASGSHDRSSKPIFADLQSQAEPLCSQPADAPGECLDLNLTKPTRVTLGLPAVEPPRPVDPTVHLPPDFEERVLVAPKPIGLSELIADQLAQLRTVVLLI